MKQLTLLFTLLTAFTGVSQVGFLSSKNMVDVSVHGNMPLLSGSFNEVHYKEKNGQMIGGKDYFNYGFSLAYSRILSKSVGIGFVFSTKDYLVTTPSFYTTVYTMNNKYKSVDTVGLKLEALRFRNYTVAPQFEFATKQGVLSMGFSYDLALGVTISTIVNDRYHYSVVENYASYSPEPSEHDSELDYFDTKYNWKPMYGLFLQTGFKFRIPLSRHFSFHTGLRYSGTFMFKSGEFENPDRIELLNNEDYYYTIRRKNLFAISLNLGITCHF